MRNKSKKIFTVKNQEVLELLGELVLNSRQMKEVSQSALDRMTYDRTQALVEEINENLSNSIKENTPGDKITTADKILWNIRMSYIHGFNEAMEIFNEFIRQIILASFSKNSLTSPIETE
jgi:hypothetical protein